jgi:dihydrofolate reductase
MSESGTVSPKVVYYVACSLDGFIAGPGGDLDWLPSPDSVKGEFEFHRFFSGIDGVIMGRRTYEVALGFGGNPAGEMPSWVLSQRSDIFDGVTVLKSPRGIVDDAAAKGCRRLWLMGGGATASAFRDAGLITDYMIASVPVLLGEGIPLFAKAGPRETLERVSCEPQTNGMVCTHYRRA